MAEEKQWEDERWSKKTYMQKPIWQEVGEKVLLIKEATEEAQDFQHLTDADQMTTVARQVMLAIYSNLQHRFDPDRDGIRELTNSNQSHWNFMLLGKLGESKWDGTTEEAARIEQPVTRYFLVKMIYRMRLHGWEIDWEGIEGALVEGCRWRVMTSPMSSEPRERWMDDYTGDPLPSVDYPSPWKLANEYKVTVEHPVPVMVEADPFEDPRPRDKKIWPCRVQNDGIVFIRPAMLKGESTNAWVIKGLKPKQDFLSDEEPNLVRTMKLLTYALKERDKVWDEWQADKQILATVMEQLEEAHQEIAVLKGRMAKPLDLRIVIDPVTGSVKHIS